MTQALLVLGNQLFCPTVWRSIAKNRGIKKIFLREDRELCTYYRFHKHKIIFFLSAMRNFALELEKAGYQCTYQWLDSRDRNSYEDALLNFLRKERIEKLCFFEIEDKFFEKRITSLLEESSIPFEVWPSPMFLTSRETFFRYLKTHSRPFMKTFYEKQRKDLRILVDKSGKPEGGKWSFDEENRKSLPKDHLPPSLGEWKTSKIVEEVKRVCEEQFSEHPGQVENFWLPVDRKGAHQWLQKFLKERLENFGPFEDAIPLHSDFVYHSVLTPFLNCGLLTPKEVIEAALEKKGKVPLASLEGFLRQVIGWREFVRGIYQAYSEKQESTNFWNHHGKLSKHWYGGNTGVPPLDQAIQKAVRFGYTHHIERLMVVGSMMVLLEIDPKEAHRWFMEMYIDSSDWVMGPNVYGMALFSDGGVFATKPYICGSNYYRKMGSYKQEAWCDGVDGLYWQFIEKHKSFFLKNPRLSMIPKTLAKMDKAKKTRIYAAADQLRAKLVKH